jgi:signal transduction histidine kinase
MAVTGTFELSMCPEPVCDLKDVHSGASTRLNLGEEGLDGHVEHREGIGWATITFDLEDPARFERPTFLLTHPADAEEIYLNGTRIGGEGVIAPDYVTVPSGPRIVTAPQSLLRKGANQLSLKVLFSGKNVSVFDGPLLLGERENIKTKRERQFHPIIATEAAFLSMFFFLICFYGFLILKGVARSDYVLFNAFTAVYATTFLLGGNLLYLSGISYDWMDEVNEFLSHVSIVLLISLIVRLTTDRMGVVSWVFIAVEICLAVIGLVIPPLNALYWLGGTRKVIVALRGAYYLFLAFRALLRRQNESLPIFYGVAVYVVGSRLDIFWGTSLRDYSVGFFALCMLYALTSRHARLKNNMVEISTRLLDAHEEERRRVARDIHDGVGQSLLGMKLKMQMYLSKARKGENISPEIMESLVADTNGVIEEVRRAAMDLRPSFVESMSLIDAMKWHAESFSERHKIEFNFHTGSEDFKDPPARIKDNLYRIFQEILTNAARHSGATRLDVSLYRSGDKLVLLATDNGKGYQGTDDNGSGIGLATMRERAELLKGTCTIESAPGKGTTIRVEVSARWQE